jgi:bile acid:Na+ symporter, BASS family
MDKVYKGFLGMCIVSAVIVIIALIMGYRAEVGPFVTVFFVSFAIGVRRIPALRSFTFTLWVVTAISTAMFYPSWFREINGFNLERLFIPLMQVIMFGMGTAMSFGDFVGVVKMPKGVFVGLLCQFSIMPFLAFVLAKIFHFPPEVAAGVILIGATPCGLASNVMNYIARANLALSVTLVAVSTLMAPVVTPLLMKLYAGQMVPIHFVDMMFVIIKIVVLPVIAGLIFNKVAHGRVKWLDRAMPIVSMAGITYIITITIAAGRDELLVIGVMLIFVEVLHNGLGYVLGYWGARLFGMDEKSCRTIAIAVGLQNGGMASGIAMEMGKLKTMGLATVVFGPWMNVSGSVVANWWSRKQITD